MTSALILFPAAIGDTDGDSEPELVVLTRLTANQITDTYSVTSTVDDLVLARVSLNDHLEKLGLVDQLLPMSQQPWRQFMGSSGDNVYRRDSKS